jgi:hypothetical protein
VKPRVWRGAVRDSELDATAPLVASRLAWRAKETLARESRKSKRAVDGAIARLVAADYLVVSEPSRGRKSNRYQATVPTVQAAAGLTVQVDARFEAANRADLDTPTLVRLRNGEVCGSSFPTESNLERHKCESHWRRSTSRTGRRSFGSRRERDDAAATEARTHPSRGGRVARHEFGQLRALRAA